MLQMPARLFPLLLLLACSLSNAQGPEVRVLLERIGGAVTAVVPEGHRGLSEDRFLFDTRMGLSWPLSAADGRLLVDGNTVGTELTLLPYSGRIRWRDLDYRGGIRFVADGDDLLVVNVLTLEEYLRGVVPAEMMANWPLEALKAQAVASRTYLMLSLYQRDDYDICATVECQAYSGIAAEHPRSDLAIYETTGLVLVYQDDFAHTYYHSDSGGSLASSAEVWGRALPYLAARADVSSSTPHRKWRYSLEPERLRLALAALGLDVGTVRAISVSAYSDSGRVLRAELQGSRGRASLSGAVLTSLLREVGLKSTRFTMVGDLLAQGDGWGHGVGMSQYGAKALADAGYPFQQILDFYYPDTELRRLAGSEYSSNPR